MSSTLLMLRPVPRMVMDVPPDIGPNNGSTPVTVGATTVNSDPPTTGGEPAPRTVIIKSLGPGLVNAVVSQTICVPEI